MTRANEPDIKNHAYAATILRWPDTLEQLTGCCRNDRPDTSECAGSQYLSIRYTKRQTQAGIDISVGSVGESYDSALAESIIGLFKTEVIKFFGPCMSVGQVEWATLKWVDWYNNARLHSAIGYTTPNEAEEAFYPSLNSSKKQPNH